MNRSTALWFLCGFFCMTIAHADMIETKRDGVINGKILSENNQELKFKDAKGQMRVFKKQDVIFQEKEKDAGPKAMNQTVEKAKEWLKNAPKNVKKTTDQLTEKFIGKMSKPLNRSAANAKSDALNRTMEEASQASTALAKKNMQANAEINRQKSEAFGSSSSEEKKGRFASLNNY